MVVLQICCPSTGSPSLQRWLLCVWFQSVFFRNHRLHEKQKFKIKPWWHLLNWICSSEKDFFDHRVIVWLALITIGLHRKNLLLLLLLLSLLLLTVDCWMLVQWKLLWTKVKFLTCVACVAQKSDSDSFSFYTAQHKFTSTCKINEIDKDKRLYEIVLVFWKYRTFGGFLRRVGIAGKWTFHPIEWLSHTPPMDPWDLISERSCIVVNGEREIIFLSRLNCALILKHDVCHFKG